MLHGQIFYEIENVQNKSVIVKQKNVFQEDYCGGFSLSLLLFLKGNSDYVKNKYYSE